MIKGGKSSVLTFADKCKSILASNWQGSLNTVKADAQGSKEEIYTSKVKYFVKKGRPYIWVPEKDLHNVNTIIDERGSFSVTSPFPGQLAHILKSIKKLPARVAILGDVVRLEDEKVELAAESLRDALLAEQRILEESSYSVTGILNSSYPSLTSRSANLQDLLQGEKQHSIYRFNISSCTYIDRNGGAHEVNPKDIEKSKADPLSSFSMSLIDGVNQNEMRRRALVLLCITFLNENAKDAFLLSIDRKGFDVLGKMKNEGWKELRFTFNGEARDVHMFCQKLLEMEEEALKNISNFSGL
ncbi:ATP synthase subunit delta [Striga asiatica]|uniref:ATP synthase subunit delta n=1 Tax=Striga asiatica TaxID=4170 RepID=A0A5A7RFH0_STRAF|nr:ATP synthase subunit delta [Striga asiatica]